MIKLIKATALLVSLFLLLHWPIHFSIFAVVWILFGILGYSLVFSYTFVRKESTFQVRTHFKELVLLGVVTVVASFSVLETGELKDFLNMRLRLWD